VSERRAADTVQNKVNCVVGRRKHVGDFHRQVDLGVESRRVVEIVRPHRGFVFVE